MHPRSRRSYGRPPRGGSRPTSTGGTRSSRHHHRRTTQSNQRRQRQHHDHHSRSSLNSHRSDVRQSRSHLQSWFRRSHYDAKYSQGKFPPHSIPSSLFQSVIANAPYSWMTQGGRAASLGPLGRGLVTPRCRPASPGGATSSVCSSSAGAGPCRAWASSAREAVGRRAAPTTSVSGSSPRPSRTPSTRPCRVSSCRDGRPVVTDPGGAV